MKVANNPLSRNLAKHFLSCGAGHKKSNGKIEVSTNIPFREECERIRMKIAEKYGEFSGSRNTFSTQFFSQIIIPNTEMPHMPYRNPNLENVRKIAEVLGVNMWEMFVDSETMIDLSTIDPSKKKLIKGILEIDDQGQLNALRAMLDVLAVAGKKTESECEIENGEELLLNQF